jgi:glycosyltransferase involved in cell wall biosynthesis
MTARSSPPLVEVITGRPRPRHLRFAAALADLVQGTALERRDQSLYKRFRTNALCRLTGVRQVARPDVDVPVLLHQALATTDRPYAVEFDVPLAIHGYSYGAYLRHADRARRLLENPALRVMFVFSEWARRSFATHFGDIVGAKCRVSYPLAAPQARFGGQERKYDFTYISKQFRVKGGPELLRAFAAVRASGSPQACMCVVTDLDEARRSLGDLSVFPGVEWRESDLGQQAIADLLCASHCLVHPSLCESFGVVVLEAIAAGCAVITTTMASFPEVVAEGSGVLIDIPVSQVVGDVSIPQFSDARAFSQLLDRLNLRSLENNLAEAMSALAIDPARRARHQQAARSLFLKRYSLEAWRNGMTKNLADAFPESDLV